MGSDESRAACYQNAPGEHSSSPPVVLLRTEALRFASADGDESCAHKPYRAESARTD